MLPLHHARRWRAASALLLLFVLAAAVMPAMWLWPDRVRIVAWFGGIDKWAHVITFVLLTVWFAGQYRRQSYWRIAIGLIAYGFLIEACQRLVTYRTAEWSDIGADVIGIIIGLAVAIAGAGGWCQIFENRYVGQRAGESVD